MATTKFQKVIKCWGVLGNPKTAVVLYVVILKVQSILACSFLGLHPLFLLLVLMRAGCVGANGLFETSTITVYLGYFNFLIVCL